MSLFSKNFFVRLVAVSTILIMKASAFLRDTVATTTFLARNSGNNRPFLSQQQQQQTATTSLSAIIYGWDGEEDEVQTATADILNSDYENSIQACDATGVALAESLTYNPDAVGSLARLAVAFSPPERALSLKDIETVHVICVSETHIDIEAIICEDGGCVSLAVPVSFPKQCDSQQWLEGCVLRNLDELNVEAESLLRLTEQRDSSSNSDDLDELCKINSKVEYPGWWVPPECDADLVAECDNIKRLLNADEFQPEVKALAQQRLEAVEDGDGYTVQQAVIAAVGPAGICLKVKAAACQFPHAEHTLPPIHVLDVMVPFGGEPIKDVETLRATVLGIVASLEA